MRMELGTQGLRRLVIGAVGLAALVAPAAAAAAPGDIEYVSKDNEGLAGNDSSSVPIVSDGGQCGSTAEAG